MPRDGGGEVLRPGLGGQVSDVQLQGVCALVDAQHHALEVAYLLSGP
jgi:hypothetical protein